MKLFRVEADPGTELDFKTDITDWKELPQIKNGYVVHARCMIIDGDVWIDHYNLMLSFGNWWNEFLSEKYEYDTFRNEDTIAFQINASGSVMVQFPKLDGDCGRRKWYLGRFLEEMGADDDSQIRWGDSDITLGDLIIDES